MVGCAAIVDVEQVTLKPGDLLYIPRGQFHDALASKNGAIHIAFGLTYFKPIDLMSSLWEKFILNDFMRQDIQLNPNKNDLRVILDKFSKEITDIITSEETLEILNTNIDNWPYKIKEYSLKSLVLEGIRYDVDKSVRFEKRDNKSFLISGTNSVEVPKQYCDLTQYILDREFITDRIILKEFKNTSKEIITECIENLTNMKVLR